MKTIKKLVHDNIPCLLQKGKYDDGRIALQMVEEKTGEYYMDVTTNIPTAVLKPNEVLINDYAASEGIAEMLLNEKIISKTQNQVMTTFSVVYPIYSVKK